MELSIIILKEDELFETLIERLRENEFKNITLLQSETFKSKKERNNTILNSIKSFLESFSEESRVLLIPVEKDKIVKLKEIVRILLSSNDYLLLTVPVNNIEGNLK